MRLLKNQALINGEWVSAASKQTFNVKNPRNGLRVGAAPHMNASDAEVAINAASEAFKTWENVTADERSALLKKWSELMQDNLEELANILSAENGKSPADAKFEIAAAISGVADCAEEAKRIEGKIVSSRCLDKKCFIEKQPIGVVGLITPWNFPVLLTARKIGIALAAGCTCVVKPSEDTPLSILALVQLAQDAEVPKGVINVLTCDRDNAPEIGRALSESPLVAGISFTGSTVAAKVLYQQCSSHVKRICLELDGNAPFLVFNSANIDKAVATAVKTKFANCGQVCISINRILVQEDVYDEFLAKLTQAFKAVIPGENLQPLINETQFKRICGIVEEAKSRGATIVLGGQPAKGVGKLHYQPTLITNVTKDMQVYKDEIFGPVVSVTKFKTEDEGVAMAVETEKVLASYLFSQDVAQIFRVSRLMRSSTVAVNEGMAGSPVALFSIIKDGARYGIDECCYLKSITIGDL